MKKILTLVLLVGVTLLASSCKKEITQVIQPNQTIIFTINQNDWVASADGSTWSASLNVPEIDRYFQDNGGVLVYINRDDDGKYEQVPMVYNGLTYSYFTNVGKIQIDAQVYDGDTPGPSRPGLTYVKVILVDSLP